MTVRKVCRVADWLLSQEDPTEAFFKSVPTSGKNNTLEVLYPVRPMPDPRLWYFILLLKTARLFHVVFYCRACCWLVNCISI